MKIKDYFFIALGCILVLPVFFISYDILLAQIKSYPVMSENHSQEWRYNFYLKHYQKKTLELVSPYDVSSAMVLMNFLFYNQTKNNKIPMDDKQTLENHGYLIASNLQKKFLFDTSLNFATAFGLLRQNKFIQAYTIIDNSYSVAPCYVPVMRYRLELKEKFGLFVDDKIHYDLDSFQQRRCLAPINIFNNQKNYTL